MRWNTPAQNINVPMKILNVWQYEDCTGRICKGAMLGFSDFGGTDITYRFHRLNENGFPIVHDNGSMTLDLVSGSRLKAATRIGNVKIED
jgi:hypothetical protein